MSPDHHVVIALAVICVALTFFSIRARRAERQREDREQLMFHLGYLCHTIQSSPESPDFARHANEALAAAAEWDPSDEEIARVTGGAA